MSDILTNNITVGSCALHLLVAGKQGARDIVLLHGLKFQAATWQELGTLDVLAENGCHAIALDMPGFGKSPTCVEEQDTVLSGVIDRKTAGKPVILGPSMGGRIALEFAIAHPQQVSALILVGAVGVEENRKRLAEIKVPTLLVWGGEDRISPLANSDILLAEIAGSARTVIKGAPHPCYLDQPDTFHAAVLDFLDSLS
jgi:abhydrolase domain-containing protein 14